MAEKVRIQIDAETKQAQKELSVLVEKYEQNKEAVDRLGIALKNIKKTGSDSIESQSKYIEKQREEYDALVSSVTRVKEKINELKSSKPNLEKATAFADKYSGNKGLVTANLKKWGISQDNISEYKALLAQQKQLEESSRLKKADLSKDIEKYNSIVKKNEVLTRTKQEQYDISNRKLQADAEQIRLLQQQIEDSERQRELAERIANATSKMSGIAGKIGYGLGAGIKVLVTGLAKVVSLAGKAAALIGKTLLKGLKSVVKLMLSPLTSALNKIQAIGKRIKQMLLFSLFRVFRRVISEGIKEIGALLKTNTQLAASLNQLKGTFITAFQPLVNAIAPVIIRIINYIQTAIAYISSLISLLGGLAKANKKSAQSMYEQAKAAKSSNSALFASWDTIQQLNQAGGGEDEPTFDFEFPDFSNNIKQMLKQLDWTELGKEVGKKLNEITKKINNWLKKDFTNTLKNTGKRIATLINGILEESLAAFASGDMDSQQGSIIANFLNGLFAGLYEFAHNLNWADVGTYIKNQIMAFFHEADTKAWGATVDAWIHGILDSMIMAISGWDTQLIADKIVGFFESIQWGQIASLVGALLRTSLQTAIELASKIFTNISELPTESQPGYVVANFLNTLVTEFNTWITTNSEEIKEIAKDFLGQIELFFETIDVGDVAELISNIGGLLLDTAIEGLTWLSDHKEEVKEKIEEFFNKLDVDETKLTEFGETIGKAIVALLDIVVVDIIPQLEAIGANIVGGILDGIVKSLTGYTVVEGLTKLDEKIAGIFGNKQGQSRTRSEYAPDIDVLASDYTMNSAEKAGQETGSSYTSGVTSGVEESQDSVEKAAKKTSQTYIDAMSSDDIKKEQRDIGKNQVKNVETGVSEEVKGAKSWYNQNVAKPVDQVVSDSLDMKGNYSGKTEGTAKAVAQGFYVGIHNNMNLIKNGMNLILDEVNKTTQAIASSFNSLEINIPKPTETATGSKIKVTATAAKLQRLAQGTVVNPSHQFAAILGDNRHEQEVVSPLSTMKQALLEALADSGIGRGQDIVLQIDGKKFAKITTPYYNNYSRSLGVSAIR